MSIQLAFALSAAALAASVSSSTAPPVTPAAPIVAPVKEQTFTVDYAVIGSHQQPTPANTINVPQFDPRIGTLVEIRVEVSVERWSCNPWYWTPFGGEVGVLAIRDADDPIDGTAFVNTPGGELDTASTIPLVGDTFTLNAGFTYWHAEVVTAPVTVSVLPKDLEPYVGRGTWPLTLTADAVRDAAASGETFVNIDNLRREGTLRVTYVSE